MSLLFTVPYYHKFIDDRRWFIGALFAILLWGILILPALINHSILYSISINTLLYTLTYSILISVSIVSAIFAPVLENIHKNVTVGILAIGTGYFFTITPLKLLFNVTVIPDILLFNISILFMLSIFLMFFYLYNNKKLLGAAVFISIYNILSSFIVSVKVSSLFNIVWEMLSIFTIFWIMYFVYDKNIYIRKLLKTKKHIDIKTRKIDKSDIIIIVVVGILCVGAFGNVYTHTIVADPTSSMYPVITPGSIVIIKPVPASQISIGDIIEFKADFANGTMYIHKVINITVINNTYYFETKGINNAVVDPKLTPQQNVVGIAVFHAPYLGYIIIYNRIVAIFGVLIIGILILFSPHKK